MATSLLEKYGTRITELKYLPSGGGVFEVMKDNSLIFSKKELNRFPEFEEIVELLEN